MATRLLPGSFQVLHFLSDLSSILQLYTMDKLQKILLAAAPIIAQPPPLPPVLQVATQAGILVAAEGTDGVQMALGWTGFSYTKVGELADKGVAGGSIINPDIAQII
jgi:hypothetical protein